MMKPTYRFRDQVNTLSMWFKEWNDCEQTVALYSLLKRVSGPQAKFLTLVLEQTLTDCDEWARLEQEANDPGRDISYSWCWYCYGAKAFLCVLCVRQSIMNPGWI